VTLGIINGGLGLLLADNTTSGAIAYGIVAAIVWLMWVAAAVYGEIKRARAQRQVSQVQQDRKERTDSSEEDVLSGGRQSGQAPGHNSPPEYYN
jgi:hypothetical protein